MSVPYTDCLLVVVLKHLKYSNICHHETIYQPKHSIPKRECTLMDAIAMHAHQIYTCTPAVS